MWIEMVTEMRHANSTVIGCLIEYFVRRGELWYSTEYDINNVGVRVNVFEDTVEYRVGGGSAKTSIVMYSGLDQASIETTCNFIARALNGGEFNVGVN